jgi:uncharacterized protein (DUF305 family)
MRVLPLRIAAALLAASAGAACRTTGSPDHPAAPPSSPPIVQPGAPGQPSQIVASDQASDISKVGATQADVKFMQGMIHHHAQALDMVALLETRTNSKDMRKLAERIRISQTDEIAMMQKWLRARGQDAPDPRGHEMADMPGMSGMPGASEPSGASHASGAAPGASASERGGGAPGAKPSGEVMMPGMLTPEQMAHLASLKGVEFDRAFLEGMIQHHGGALTMVQELFATPGAGQESVIFAFASDVDADQRMEIDRMRAMLAKLKESQE